MVTELLLPREAPFIDRLGTHRIPVPFSAHGIETDTAFFGQIMADGRIVFTGILSHIVTHDGIVVGPAILEMLVTVPTVCRMGHFQRHIPGAIPGQRRQIEASTPRYIGRQIMRLVFAIEFSIECHLWQTETEITTGDIIPAVVAVIIVAAIGPMLPVRPVQAVMVSAQYGNPARPKVKYEVGEKSVRIPRMPAWS